MTTKQHSASLTVRDLELIERMIWKNGDDTAVSIARSFERLEERLDGAESRLYSRMTDLEDQIATMRNKAVSTNEGMKSAATSA
jgi:hypothetical protein